MAYSIWDSGDIVLMFWFFLIFVLWSSYFFSPHYQHIQLYWSILLLLLCFSSFFSCRRMATLLSRLFQLLSNQKEMLFWGDTLWWNRRRGEVCTVQELIAHECSSTEERPCGALFKVKHSLKDVIVPLVNAWQVFELPLVGWGRPLSNKSTKWKKTIHMFLSLFICTCFICS